MICFNCGYRFTSNDVKECNLCGMKTPLKCTACGSPNPIKARYCFNCGTQIVNKDNQSSVDNFDTLLENRKNVAVIFADISGFTSLSEKMDPEEVREIINECFDFITKPVYELEGTIDKFIGDCIMILFGARYSHTDDPKRAVTCALEMLKLIREFSRERLYSKGISLSISIGINYGLVVTGSIGNYFDKDYTVMGDIVNTAQRLQNAADKDTILVSESVYDETRDSFNYSGAKELTVKNKEKPIRCYIPRSAKADSSDKNSLLVERNDELNYIDSIYRSAEEARYVFLAGESGIGKTSLIKEFVSRQPDNIKKIRVDCSSIYQNKTNYVISTLLHSIMNINSDDSSNAKKYRFMSYIYYILDQYTEAEKQKNCNFLGILAGLDRENDFQNVLNSMKYSDIEREILNQLVIFFANLIKKQDFIFVIDDTQWADRNSINLLHELKNQLTGTGSFFIFASQHHSETHASDRENLHRVLKLKGLSKEGTRTLICKLLDCSLIDDALLAAVMKYTYGNPLYIKEFIANIKRKGNYAIKDGTVYVDDSAIASLSKSLESIILANLSELDNSTLDLLQTASVIGKEFRASWLKSLIENSGNMENMLAAPLLMNIISLKSAYAVSGDVEKVYSFNQDTTMEAIYSGILKRKRNEIHKRIGELIESKYPNDLENYYEILSFHFEKAGIKQKAEEYYYKSALLHKDNFNFTGALDYFSRYLELGGFNANRESNSRTIHTYINTGYIYTVLADYSRALENLNKALERAILSDDIYTIKLMIIDIYKEMGQFADAISIIDEIETRIRPNSSIYGRLLQLKCTILRMQGSPEALRIAEESEQILLKARDYDSLSETMRQAAYIYFSRGDIDNSLFSLNKAHGYAEKTMNLRALAGVSKNLGIIYHASGRVSKAFEYFNEAIELSSKISDIQGLVSSKANLGVLFIEKGLFDKAELLFNEVLDTSGKVSLTYGTCLALLNLGDIMYEKGNYKAAYDRYIQSLDIARKHNFQSEEGINYIGFIKLYLKTGAYDDIPETLEKAYKILTDCDELSYISDYYRLKSVLELVDNNSSKAMDYCEKAITTAEEAGNDFKKLKAIRLKGIILGLLNEHEKSLEFYDKSINLAEQLESDYEAAKGYYRKAGLLRQTGHDASADENMVKAADAIARVDKCRWTSIINSASHGQQCE